MENDHEKRIAELEAELEKATEELADLELSRQAMLNLQEDMEEMAKALAKAKDSLEEEANTTRHLLMISEATAHATDVDVLMENVVHCVSEIMRCDVCLSYLYDSDKKVFQPSQNHGLAPADMPLFIAEPLDEKMEFVRKAVEGKEPVIERISGQGPAKSDNRPPTTVFSWLPYINTLAAIPVIGRNGPLGLIVCAYKEVHDFSERDKKVGDGVSQAVSLSLEEAESYRSSVEKSMELANKIEIIETLHEIDKRILSTLRPAETLEIVTKSISRIIPCDMAMVGLVDKEKQVLVFTAGFGIDMPKGTLIPFRDTSAADVVKTGRPQYVPNVKGVRVILTLEKRFLDDGFVSHIMVPLTAKGEVMGVLSIGARRVAAFTTENLFVLEKLASQIGIALENGRLLADLEELFIATVKSLSSAIDAKSTWTAGHSERVTKYALDIAKHMGLSEKELKDLELAGLLHDIGKIGTYESILDKPGKLTDEELTIMRLHPVKGAEILAPIKQLKDIIPGVKYHHEFYDGTGYPEGLKGESIPLCARILAVADTCDAMKADRPYRKGRTMEFVIAEFKRCSGTQFDPKVAEAFLKGLSQKDIV